MTLPVTTGGPSPNRANPGFDEFVRLLRGLLDLDLDGVTPDHRLNADLGIDSIMLFELFVWLEGVAAREVPHELMDSLETMGDLFHWYSTFALQASSGQASAWDGSDQPSPDSG